MKIRKKLTRALCNMVGEGTYLLQKKHFLDDARDGYDFMNITEFVSNLACIENVRIQEKNRLRPFRRVRLGRIL